MTNILPGPDAIKSLKTLKRLKVTLAVLDILILICMVLICSWVSNPSFYAPLSIFILLCILWPLLAIILIAYCCKMRAMLSLQYNQKDNALRLVLKILLILAIALMIVGLLIPPLFLTGIPIVLNFTAVPLLILLATLMNKPRDDAMLLEEFSLCTKNSKTAKNLTLTHGCAIKFLLINVIIVAVLYVLESSVPRSGFYITLSIFGCFMLLATIAQIANLIIFSKAIKTSPQNPQIITTNTSVQQLNHQDNTNSDTSNRSLKPENTTNPKNML